MFNQLLNVLINKIDGYGGILRIGLLIKLDVKSGVTGPMPHA